MKIEEIRSDFPIIEETAYLDNACMTLKPKPVMEAVNRYYTNFPVCGGGRSPNKLSQELDDKIARGREAVKQLLNAEKKRDIVFTKNTTEAINMVAKGLNFDEKDKVISTDKEHNSNLAPWLNENIELEQVLSKEDHSFDIEQFKEMMDDDVKLVSMVHTSNLDGTTTPAKAIADIAHDYGALFLLDAAQSVPHQEVDVKDLDVDLLAFSVHKMLGPTGVGVLYGKEGILEELEPINVGGGNTRESTYGSFELHPPPRKFESGLQNYASLAAVEDAVHYIQRIGLKNIKRHERELNSYLTEGLKDDVKIIGPDEPARRSGILSIDTSDMDSSRILKRMDDNDIIVRSGRHCCYSWYNRHDIEDSVRVSTYVYNTKEELDRFIQVLNEFI